MKQILIATMFLASCLLMAACQQKQESKSLSGVIDTVAIKASMDSLGAVVQKANDTKDSEMLAMTWSKDGILSAPGNPTVFGRDSIVSFFKNMPPPPPGGAIKINPIEIKILSKEWVYIFGIDSLKYTPPGAKKQIVETSTFFVLVRKTGEGWQTYREILSPNQPMSATK